MTKKKNDEDDFLKWFLGWEHVIKTGEVLTKDELNEKMSQLKKHKP